MPPKRKYELKKRAEEMAETRLRITEAAIDLHGSVGPSRTTLSAVAKRAGVERRTLYRHFPNEADLFAACSTHYFAANPWPDLGGWRAIRDPQQRLERALDELYAYYERTEPMFSNVLRDAEVVDFARDAVAPLHAYLEEAAEVLAHRPSGPRPEATTPRGSAAPRPRLLDLALTLGQRHRASGCGEAHDRARRPLTKNARWRIPAVTVLISTSDVIRAGGSFRLGSPAPERSWSAQASRGTRSVRRRRGRVPVRRRSARSTRTASRSRRASPRAQVARAGQTVHEHRLHLAQRQRRRGTFRSQAAVPDGGWILRLQQRAGRWRRRRVGDHVQLERW